MRTKFFHLTLYFFAVGFCSFSDAEISLEPLQMQIDLLKQQINVLEDRSIQASTLEKQPIGLSTEQPLYTAVPYGNTLLGNIGGTAVITSPFVHSRYDFRGSGLIVNYSSINRDVSALIQRRDFYNQMHTMGFSIPAYPVLELSGEVEGEFSQYRAFNGHQGNSFDISDAELDMQALVNDWFSGFMSFAYNRNSTSSGNRIFNSNLYLDSGFITFGDLNKIPYYVTIGQIYAPFGEFDSYLISDPLNKIIFRTKARALTLGYQSLSETGFYGALFGFQGPTRRGHYEPKAKSRSPSSQINTFGLNAGYNYSIGPVSGLFGASVISNIADSLGMQATGGEVFQGFASSSTTEVLRHRVPGYDLRTELYYDPFSLIAELSCAARSFSPLDMTYNGYGAKPSGYHLEAVYKFDLLRRPSNLAIGYGQSFEALALNVPAKRAAITLNAAIWKNTLASIEFRHDINYSNNDTASGGDGPLFYSVGSVDNAVTAHFDIYF